MSLRVQPLPFLRRTDSGRVRAIRVHWTGPALTPGASWSLRVVRDSWERTFPLQGAEPQQVFIPESESPIETSFTAIREDQQETSLLLIDPVRKWTVHLVLHSHTDLGFTAPVSDVARLHNDNTDRAIAYCRETAHLPEGLRFKWTCEVTWQVQNYIRDRKPDQVAALMDFVRSGAIGIGAMYSGELTGLLGHEEAVRCFAYAGYLRRKYGVPCDTAMLCDVPGCTAGLVQIMAKSGIRALIVADNNFAAPFLPRTDLPRPFLWTGSDNSEVACWFTDHPFYAYVEGEYYGFLESRGKVEQMLGEKLLALEQQGYPYDRFQIQYAFDNAPITFVPARIVQEWAAHWEYPKIILSTAREFLGTMREEHRGRLPRRSGDWTDWWGGIVTGFPADEAFSREYHLRTPAVETLASHLALRGSGVHVPEPRITRAYDGLLAFDEHSGGGMIWQPKSREDQDRALREGYGFLHTAMADVDEFQKESLDLLSAHVVESSGNKPASSLGTDIHTSPGIALPHDHPPGLQEPKPHRSDHMSHADPHDSDPNHQMSPHDITRMMPDGLHGVIGVYNPSGVEVSRAIDIPTRSGGPVVLHARTIPPYGYKLFPIDPAEPDSRKDLQHVQSTAGKTSLVAGRTSFTVEDTSVRVDSPFCRIVIDRSSGRWVSFRDTASEMEYVAAGAALNAPAVYLVRPVVQFELGKFIPELYDGTSHPGDFLPWPSASQAFVSWENTPDGGARCRVEHRIEDIPWLTQEYLVDGNDPGVAVVNTLLRASIIAPQVKEGLHDFLQRDGTLYFCFPFALPGAEFEYEGTASVLRPRTDQFRGSCHDFVAIQRWCALRRGDSGILVIAHDSPLVDVGSPGLHTFKLQMDDDPSAVFFRAVTLREWGSEDESPFTRDRDLVFRYHLSTIGAGNTSEPVRSFRAHAHRRAVQQTAPLMTFAPIASHSIQPLPTERQFFSLTPASVELMTFKHAESGEGWVVRIREAIGEATNARIRFPGFSISSCHSATMTEEREAPLPHTSEDITISCAPFAIHTFIVELTPLDVAGQRALPVP